MMALIPTNLAATGPAVPPAPPGVAMADGVFDLLMPITLPTDPRHEPAPDGKQVGKDMPVEGLETDDPLAWLPTITPPVVAPTSNSEADNPAVATVMTPIPLAKTPDPVRQTPASPTVHPASHTASPPAMESDGAPKAAMPKSTTANAAQPPSVMPPAPDVAPVAPSLSNASPIPPMIAVAPTPIEPATASPILEKAGTSAMPIPIAPAQIPSFSPREAPREAARELPKAVTPLERNVASEAPALQPPPSTPRIAPAAQVFADAIRRATRDDRGPAMPEVTGPAATDIKTHAITATTDAQHNALDLRQEHWPARMMERIEALRDAANANDTSIRLIPDALGKIDVSLKRDGDTVAVQFTAQQPETRQLLADAAPKLAELAEARGLKLAQGGTDTTGQQQPRQQQAAPAATAPRPALTDDTESTDTRIA